MLIRELAQKTGVEAYTIRFYEKEGLIDTRCIMRSENNYRSYTSDAVERILMIKQGQAAGFTLGEIKTLMQAWDAGELTTREQRVYIEQKIADISEKIAELETIRRYLADKLMNMNEEEERV